MYGGAGTVGKAGILGIPAATNQAVCCIEPNYELFDPMYLLYYMVNFRSHWMKYAIGTRKDPNIGKGIIENTKIALPPLHTQKKVSQIIKGIEDKILSESKYLNTLNVLFRSFLQRLLYGQIRIGKPDQGFDNQG